jgi:hypothetical protein
MPEQLILVETGPLDDLAHLGRNGAEPLPRRWRRFSLRGRSGRASGKQRLADRAMPPDRSKPMRLSRRRRISPVTHLCRFRRTRNDQGATAADLEAHLPTSPRRRMPWLRQPDRCGCCGQPDERVIVHSPAATERRRFFEVPNRNPCQGFRPDTIHDDPSRVGYRRHQTSSRPRPARSSMRMNSGDI